MQTPTAIAHEAVYATIHAVLGRYTFVAPVELDDCTTVRNDLLAALPKFRVAVWHRYTQIAVQVFGPDGIKVFDWNKPVT